MKTFMNKTIKSFPAGQDGLTPQNAKNSEKRSSLSTISIKPPGSDPLPGSTFPFPRPLLLAPCSLLLATGYWLLAS